VEAREKELAKAHARKQRAQAHLERAHAEELERLRKSTVTRTATAPRAEVEARAEALARERRQKAGEERKLKKEAEKRLSKAKMAGEKTAAERMHLLTGTQIEVGQRAVELVAARAQKRRECATMPLKPYSNLTQTCYCTRMQVCDVMHAEGLEGDKPSLPLAQACDRATEAPPRAAEAASKGRPEDRN